ncbi:uncharacterized protein LOC135139622 [Zophobas morio]|uniref:uncharacterized protein LOC135139622 n=1 Tax=Zophobas morio TaxID=2755281 RepID=UPI003083C31C
MKKYDWVSTIKLNLTLLKAMGLWPEGQTYKFDLYLLYGFTTTIMFATLHCVCRTWKLLTNLNDLDVVTGTAFLSISETLVVVKMLYMARNIETFKELLVTLNSDLFQPRDEDQIELVTPSLNVWKSMHNLLGISIVVAVTSYAVAPLVTGSAKKHNLPLLASYPYDATISPFFEVTYLHQVITIYIYGCCNANIDTFVAAFNLYAGAQLDILCDDLR